MKGLISIVQTKLKEQRYFPKWENIVPFLLLTVFVSAQNPTEKGRVKKTIQTIVIDAGHGGTDPGCISHGVQEKDVTLSIALAVGAKLKERHPELKIIYTRSEDKFVKLWERAAIANKSNADLFISIHCNSAKNSSSIGTETFAMGLHKAEENLEVAKRENEVVLLEDNYQEKYEGFDPNSPESHIYFSLFQNAFMDQSIRLAARVENQISKGINRPSRGVKQAGFLVLWQTRMPSILIETGFLTNPKDREYLSSNKGVKEFSSALVDAIIDYKKAFDGVSDSKQE